MKMAVFSCGLRRHVNSHVLQITFRRKAPSDGEVTFPRNVNYLRVYTVSLAGTTAFSSRTNPFNVLAAVR
jgi:hypothetical protein